MTTKPHPSFTRPQAQVLRQRLGEPRRFIQVIAGPRQVGKTTLVRDVLAGISMPRHVASADEPFLRDTTWITQQWDAARLLLTSGSADWLCACAR